MNTLDKILLGLSCHARSNCSGCPYEDMPECSSKLAADAEKMYKETDRERYEAVELIGKLIVILKKYPRAATNGCAFQAYMEIKKYLLNIRGVEVE